jgi:hypothetical protein
MRALLLILLSTLPVWAGGPIPRNKTKQVILAISKKRILPNPE